MNVNACFKNDYFHYDKISKTYVHGLNTCFKAVNYVERVKVCGKIVDYYRYGKPVFTTEKPFKRLMVSLPHEKTAEEKQKVMIDSGRRARNMVRDLCNCNADELTKFVTLTFADNVQDIELANYEFNKFIKRLKTYLVSAGAPALKYLAVIEFQKRGAIHYHVLINTPYIPNAVLNKIWSFGFVRINSIDKVDNVGAYVSKYMGKDLQNDNLQGKKRYFRSRNLKTPVIVTKSSDIGKVLSSIDNVVRQAEYEYESQYYGVVKHVQLICKNAVVIPVFPPRLIRCDYEKSPFILEKNFFTYFSPFYHYAVT